MTRGARTTLRFCAAAALAGCSSGSIADDGGASTDAAVSDHALHFDGIRDYASTGTAGFPRADAAQTVSMWVRFPPPSPAAVESFITMRRDNESGTAFGIRGNALAAWTTYGDRILVQTPALPSANAWHHVAYVFNPGVLPWTATLYVDGVAAATTTNANPNNLTPYSCWLGSYDGLTAMFEGDLDDIRIWSVVRSTTGIVQDMHGPVDPAAPGLVAYFSCDRVDALRVADDSGHGDTMTLGGGDPGYAPSLIAATHP